jgi:hypothetical protein
MQVIVDNSNELTAPQLMMPVDAPTPGSSTPFDLKGQA